MPEELFEKINGKTIDLPNGSRAAQILHQKRIEYLKTGKID